MTTHIARRLERLEERLALSDAPRFEVMFIQIVRPSPDGPVYDPQIAKFDDGTILDRDSDETRESFENRVHQSLPPFTGRIAKVILGLHADFKDR